MAITLNSFTAGQVIVAADMNTNFNNINSWSDTVALKAGAAFTGNVTITSGTFIVGANAAGDDVKFFGDTSGAYVEWDADTDDLIFAGAARVVIPDGQLVLGSTAVTSTAAELNILDGVTASTAEINILDGVVATNAELNTVADITLGTVTADKAVTVDANKDVTGFRNITATGTTTLATTTIGGIVNVGSDGSGHDVIFHSATGSDYFFWDASDEILKITGVHGQNALSVLDGNVYIADGLDVDGSCSLDSLILDGNLAFTGTLFGTSSIPRMAYNASGAATVASNQLDSNPTIFICTTTPTATAAGDIWFDI